MTTVALYRDALPTEHTRFFINGLAQGLFTDPDTGVPGFEIACP